VSPPGLGQLVRRQEQQWVVHVLTPTSPKCWSRASTGWRWSPRSPSQPSQRGLASTLPPSTTSVGSRWELYMGRELIPPYSWGGGLRWGHEVDVKRWRGFQFCKVECMNRLAFSFPIWWPIMDMAGYSPCSLGVCWCVWGLSVWLQLSSINTGIRSSPAYSRKKWCW
jgi:hypothetical protein